MNNALIQRIIDTKVPCYFVSPHLDDALFSAGGLIAYLSKHTAVEVITAFTDAERGPSTLSAKAFLKQCGYTRAEDLFTQRRSEDARALNFLGIQPRHLGYSDALWRTVANPGIIRRAFSGVLPELVHVYPTYRLHATRGTISRNDAALFAALGEKLKEIIPADAECVVFCPMAVGSHVDHVLVRDVCLANFKNVLLWQDFPYSIRDPKDARTLGKEVLQWSDEQPIKQEMMTAYTTQVKAMFPDGHIPSVPEVYYASKVTI